MTGSCPICLKSFGIIKLTSPHTTGLHTRFQVPTAHAGETCFGGQPGGKFEPDEHGRCILYLNEKKNKIVVRQHEVELSSAEAAS